MDRPKITKEMVLEAAKEIAEKLDGDAETIADHYRHPRLEVRYWTGEYWEPLYGAYSGRLHCTVMHGG